MNESEYINVEKDVYKECFVGYLDILGFEEIVEQESPSNILLRLKDLLSQSKITCGTEHESSRVTPILMSDTLLLYTKDDDKASFKQLIGAIAEIINMSIITSIHIDHKKSAINLSFDRLKFLIRGAISWGDFYFNDIYYFGPAYNDAYRWEKKQAWIGAILTPACSKFIRSKGYNTDELLIEYDDTLLKDAKSKEEYGSHKPLCINWTTDFPEDLINKSFYENVEIKHREKYLNTYNFLSYCTKLGGN